MTFLYRSLFFAAALALFAAAAPKNAPAAQPLASCVTLYPSAPVPGTTGTFIVIRRVTINPGGRGTLHSHQKNEYVSVVSGHGTMVEADGTSTALSAGVTMLERSGKQHYAKNASATTPLVYLSTLVGSPNKTWDFTQHDTTPGPHGCPQ